MLTNEDLLEIDTKQKIDDITGRINLLTENFQKSDYPFESEEAYNERQKAVSEEGGWGIVKVSSGTGSIENTIEVNSSKSESNRLLIIKALSKKKININNISNANDTAI